MRKSLWIMLALMVAAVSAPGAQADDITLDVSGTFAPGTSLASCSPSCQMSGTLVFDNVTGAIISADITFTGDSPAVGGPFTRLTSESGIGGPPGAPGDTFVTFADSLGEAGLELWVVNPASPGTLIGYDGGSLLDLTFVGEFTDQGGSGAFWNLISGSLTPEVAAPEPSSLSLVLLGLAPVLLLRKRNPRDHQT